VRADSYVRAQRISSAGVKEDRKSDRRTSARPWLRVNTERLQQVLQGIRSSGTGQLGCASTHVRSAAACPVVPPIPLDRDGLEELAEASQC